MSHETKTADPLPSTAPIVHNGTYTVSHETDGHFTVKLSTSIKGKLAGKRIAAILTGSNNEADYTSLAFYEDEDDYTGGPRAFVWRRFQGEGSKMPVTPYNWQSEGWSKSEKKLAVWLDLVVRGESSYWLGRGYKVQHAGTCVRCNRKLTDPVSIETGIGPVCAGRS